MTPKERSVKLKLEADRLLKEIRLAERCQEIGPLTPTGSYYLDLMIYPDIDLYLPPTTPRQLFEIAAWLVEQHPVQRVYFLNGGPGPLKDALYIKPVIAVGKWERPWKIDIWAVDQSYIDEKQAELSDQNYRMTPDQRDLILAYKFSILNAQGRTPYFSGIHIYHAEIDHGLTQFADISAYLRAYSIQI